jgi:hypothetical protein
MFIQVDFNCVAFHNNAICIAVKYESHSDLPSVTISDDSSSNNSQNQ